MKPLFSYAVNSKQIMDLHFNFNQQHLRTFCVIFMSCHPPPVFGLHLKARVLNVSESGEQISSDQLTPGDGSMDVMLQPVGQPVATREILINQNVGKWKNGMGPDRRLIFLEFVILVL